jgi:hypothetical protein
VARCLLQEIEELKHTPKVPKAVKKKNVKSTSITQSTRAGFFILTDSASNKLSINLGTNWIGYYDKKLNCWVDLFYEGGNWSSMSGEVYKVEEIPIQPLKNLIQKLMSTLYGKRLCKKKEGV